MNVSRIALLTPKAKKLHKVATNMRKTARRLDREFSNMKNQMKKASKFSESLEHMRKKLNEPSFNFLMSQLQQQTIQPKGRRYTLNDKIFALSLMKQSPKGYKLFSKVFAVPSRKTLTNLLGTVPFNAGINSAIFEQLKETVQKIKDLDKYCTIIFDEITVDPSLTYNMKCDLIMGFQDNGTGQNVPVFADKAMVFMARGIHKKLKQPLAYYFSAGGIKAPEITRALREVVRATSGTGLHVIATICDQGAPNVASIEQLYEETNESFLRSGQENRLFGFNIDGQEIVPLYDPPHLLKGIKNNLFNHGKCEFISKDGPKIASWDDIRQVYHIDLSAHDDEYRMLHKITEDHINNTKKMKVSHAAQVFSQRVASVLYGLGNVGKNLFIII